MYRLKTMHLHLPKCTASSNCVLLYNAPTQQL